MSTRLDGQIDQIKWVEPTTALELNCRHHPVQWTAADQMAGPPRRLTRGRRRARNELSSRHIDDALWKSPGGTAEMLCSDKCWLDFRTPKTQAERDLEPTERANKDASRLNAT